MNKRLTKPHEKNERLERPCGLLGVPPDLAPETYVLITNDMSVKEIIEKLLEKPGHYYMQ